ncbi:carboxylate-amine ligase [Actinomyces gaoshouyii]|uniref:Putative glutamate--cysteine ligase 2 n=1 Tax=Actinomyces gaoshouyii TaxID=1960083 RepID=A0A8H9LLD5_9ACTO|nr:YbdK family carboxylate-amine ligase [Actinomyces gaoshouyii]ARD41823.1 carboxylate--amine ligase [Actinomyces gaoshouyii]GGO97373.1 putative glutamate--cysteine ligase 2 [Actinomyces gaoshouyii]
MSLRFAASARSTIGVEWELQIIDPATLRPVPCAPEILAEFAHAHPAHGRIHAEMLRNTLELVSRPRRTVAGCAEDMGIALDMLAPFVEAHEAVLVGSGTHPFVSPASQGVSESERYGALVDRTRYWGRQMLIFGTHVHVGVEDRAKVLPIGEHLLAHLPHLQSLAAASPFWDGEDTGYADNRAWIFRQLPHAGLPEWPGDWAGLEALTESMLRAGAIKSFNELRWDVRPSPGFGTIEARICDASSNLLEVRAIAALTQCLVESASQRLDEGLPLARLPRWFLAENKWRSARYGLDATIVTSPDGEQAPLRQSLSALATELEPVAQRLGCADDLALVQGILTSGAGYERQRWAHDDSGLEGVVEQLIGEMRAGRPLP